MRFSKHLNFLNKSLANYVPDDLFKDPIGSTVVNKTFTGKIRDLNFKFTQEFCDIRINPNHPFHAASKHLDSTQTQSLNK